jgi:hypothetical protein
MKLKKFEVTQHKVMNSMAATITTATRCHKGWLATTSAGHDISLFSSPLVSFYFKLWEV